MKTSLIIVLLLNTVSLAFSQQFTIRRVEVSGDKINLYYDLVDDLQRNYTIALYASRDNYISPLEKVGGDIGLEIKPGGNHKIVWSAKEELGADFEGKIALEVRGRVYIPFVRLDGLHKSFKRDKPYELTWTGGTQQNILNFELYKGESKVTTFPNIANVGHYTLTMPLSVKPGKDYKFKITDSRNKDQIVYSQPFGVSRKIPLLLKGVPIALVAGGVYFLTSGTKDSQNIPDPIVPE